MLHSIPYNKYTDGTGLYANELFCMNKKFDKCLTTMDLYTMAQASLTIYEELLKIQFSLNEEKSVISSDRFEEYQAKLDEAFKYARILDKKLANARKYISKMAKDGKIKSNDSILFSSDDELIQ